MPALRDLKRKRCELPVPTDQPQKRSGPLCLLQRVPLSVLQRSLQKSRAPQRPATAHTSSADAVCSTLDPLHCSKDTAQLFAENRHMRTVNRLLVRVASRHRAKAAACRLESSRRAQKTTIIFMHLWRQSRQTELGCICVAFVHIYTPGVVAVMGGDGRRCTLRRADAAAGRQSGGGAASLTHGP